MPLGRTVLFSITLIFLANFLTSILLIVTSTTGTSQAYLTQLEFAPTLLVLILGVVVLPIYEEVVFRLFLVPSPMKILISISLITGLAIGYMLMSIYGVGARNPILVLVALPIVITPLVALMMIIPFKKGLYPSKRVSILAKLENALYRDVRPAYYISAILFSVAHVVFQKLLLTMTTSIMVMMFFNYFFVGLVLGNVRISKGIGYAIIIHFIVNLLAYLKVFV